MDSNSSHVGRVSNLPLGESVPEVIQHGVSGYMADVGDVATMARLATELLSDSSRLKQMGEQARNEARARFCASKIIPIYEEFYRKVLERAS